MSETNNLPNQATHASNPEQVPDDEAEDIAETAKQTHPSKDGHEAEGDPILHSDRPSIRGSGLPPA
jgi:hypothetical protein